MKEVTTLAEELRDLFWSEPTAARDKFAKLADFIEKNYVKKVAVDEKCVGKLLDDILATLGSSGATYGWIRAEIKRLKEFEDTHLPIIHICRACRKEMNFDNEVVYDHECPKCHRKWDGEETVCHFCYTDSTKPTNRVPLPEKFIHAQKGFTFDTGYMAGVINQLIDCIEADRKREDI